MENLGKYTVLTGVSVYLFEKSVVKVRMVGVVAYLYEKITGRGKFGVPPFVEVIVEVGEKITLCRKSSI